MTSAGVFVDKHRALANESCRLIQELLKTTEHLADFIRLAEVGDGIVDGVVVFQTQ